MREETLDRLHDGHLGIVKRRARAQMSVWRPGLSSQLQDLFERCDTCRKQKGDHPEPMIPMETSQRAWQVV